MTFLSVWKKERHNGRNKEEKYICTESAEMVLEKVKYFALRDRSYNRTVLVMFFSATYSWQDISLLCEYIINII